jgi:MoaA/NifB/PqqE/SkfB family radical SAM enzyme
MLGSGDPFASKLTRDLMSQLPQLKHHPQLELCLQTNGILFTPERLTEILSNGLKIRRVLVSIDAATPETYSKLRGGQWNVLMTNICNLREHNIPLQLNFVVQEDNYKEIVAFVELSRNLGALIVYFSALENWGQFSKEEYEKVAVHLRSHPHNKDLHDLLWSLNWWERRSPIINISSLSSLFQKETTCNCP